MTGIQFKELDTYTIEHEPVESIDLMERAARKICELVIKTYPREMPVKIFAGPGGNGGDALAIGRMMAEKGYSVTAFLFNIRQHLAPDCQTNMIRLQSMGIEVTEITKQFNAPKLSADDLIIDGLFGTGLKQPLEGGFASVVDYINRAEGHIVSIDIPSGMMCEMGVTGCNGHVVKAEMTISVQTPKLAFIMPEPQEYLGRLEYVDIGLSNDYIDSAADDYTISEETDIKAHLSPRNQFTHKGNYGSVLIIAGKHGMAGAAVLSAKACLRSGAGKVHVGTASLNNDIIQISTPEAIIAPCSSPNRIDRPFDTKGMNVVAIGPGIGSDIATAEALHQQLTQTYVPMVIDADAINILSAHPSWIDDIPKGSILTPHPKEFDRLTGNSCSRFTAIKKAKILASTHDIYVVLKGAYTAIVTPEEKVIFNPTGNPGMATAGSGDTLTGIIAALLAQGHSSLDAAVIGTYVHGMAGDTAAQEKGETAMTASDIIEALPHTFKQLIGK